LKQTINRAKKTKEDLQDQQQDPNKDSVQQEDPTKTNQRQQNHNRTRTMEF